MGRPFAPCPGCGIILSRKDHVNEWFLLNRFQKAEYTFVFTVTGIMLGAGCGLLIAAIIHFSGLKDMEQPTPMAIAVIPCAIIGMTYWMIRFRQAIRESILRFQSPQYLQQLRELGFLKDSPKPIVSCPSCGRVQTGAPMLCSCGYDFFLKKVVR